MTLFSDYYNGLRKPNEKFKDIMNMRFWKSCELLKFQDIICVMRDSSITRKLR